MHHFTSLIIVVVLLVRISCVPSRSKSEKIHSTLFPVVQFFSISKEVHILSFSSKLWFFLTELMRREVGSYLVDSMSECQ